MSACDRTVSGIPIDAVYGGGPGVPDGLPPPPENTNEVRHLLREGQTGLSVAFDMPTLMGYDPDTCRLRASRAAGPSARIPSSSTSTGWTRAGTSPPGSRPSR